MSLQRFVMAGVLALFVSGCTHLPPAEPVYGPTNPTVQQQADAGVRYYGSAIELDPAKERLYRELHADVWPDVLAAIERANIRNYNIFVADLGGRRYLFSFFEYHGSDPDADFARIAEDPTTRDKWWPITDTCQRRLPGTPEGEQWKAIEMLMHID
ncbi:MAG: L-rhamnose mutarotase [Phycisphaerales bacterium JB063]